MRKCINIKLFVFEKECSVNEYINIYICSPVSLFILQIFNNKIDKYEVNIFVFVKKLI